ncbi:MAG: 3-hydroxyacyl-CoA dehydrogenase NAD-binding domain-containing protein [Halobacteriales archaeon]|nr:3-hydroxyacyl-CoA dehydrogenase NAD-binding domain-containing protein [Halobacteriales archaeon]
MTTDIDRVAVIGAGSMGHGIAEVAAIAGYAVSLRDIERELVEEGYDRIEWSLGKLADAGQLEEDPEAVLDRVDTAVDLEAAVEDADLVIEAAPEQLDLKRELFADLDEYAPADALLATNTSSLSITEIAAATDRPGQVLGLHFFNPPVKMALVEVIHGEATTAATAEAGRAWVESIGKTPITVHKDVHGFVVNTVLVPFMDEAAFMLGEDEATVQGADAAMVYRRGYPMGPFELNDFGGIDIAYHFRDEAGQPVPEPVAAKVEAGELGRKSGRGFYEYEGGPGPDYEPGDGEGFDTLRVEARMVNEAARLVGDDVATPEAIDLGLRLGGRFPEGTCRTGDKLGLDRVLAKLRELHEATGADRYEPADHLVELVEAGHTGEGAGRGFYDYADPPYFYLDHELDEGVLTVTLDRQERLNALSMDMFDEIDRLLRSVDVDDVACVVFEGAGDRAFSAGADVTAFTTMEPAEMMDTDRVFETVAEFDRPTIAKIDGFCLGAGFELALACDLRIATENARFGTPEIDLGLIPGGGATQRLVRLVGEMRTKELLFRGEQFSGERAAEWGIVNRAVPAEALDDTVAEFVDDIAAGPPIALKLAKQVVHEGQDAPLDTGLEYEKKAFALLMGTDDMVEGVQAFHEDREPAFRGT